MKRVTYVGYRACMRDINGNTKFCCGAVGIDGMRVIKFIVML